MSTSSQLRPMNIGDILDASFRLYRTHFVTFLGITALLQVPVLILQVLVQYVLNGSALTDLARYSSGGARASGTNPLSSFPISALVAIYAGAIALAILQYLVVHNLLTGALARTISRSYMGEPISILDAYRIGWSRFFALVVASLVPFLASFLVLIPIFAAAVGVAFAVSAGGQGAATLTAIVAVLGGIAIALVLVCGAVFLYVRFLFSTQTIVLEQLGPIHGLRRSWELTRGAFWRTLVTMVLMGILVYLVSALPATAVNLALAFTSRGVNDLLRNSVITTLISQTGMILALPLQFCTYTLLYYDQRVRKEGLDIEMRAQAAEAALA